MEDENIIDKRYVATLLRALIREGVITLVSSMGGALAIGPAGYALGFLSSSYEKLRLYSKKTCSRALNS
uniref:Uncharacterized protein n=1 Tax=Rhodnius prolixus TaxID=13249 RepID=T1HKM8_RHOPR